MGFDGIIIRRLASLFAPKLIGAKVNRIGKLNKTDFIFLLYHQTQLNLLISLDANSPHLNLDTNKYQLSQDVNHFLSILRVHLEGAIISNFSQVGLDRIYKIEFKITDETNQTTVKYLYVELTGKRLNLILTKDNQKIIEAYAKESVETSARLLFAGATYQPPLPLALKDPLTEKYDVSKLPSEQFIGISPLLEQEILALKLNESSFNTFIKELLNSTKLYLGTYKNKKDFHLLPLSIFNQDSIKELEISEGIKTYYSSLSTKKETSELASNLNRIVKQQIKRLNTRLERLENDYKNATNYQTFKYYGDIIYASGKDIGSGLKDIILIDPENNKNVTIPLDPKISLFKNAERYFLKYHKAKNALDILQEQISSVKSEVENLEYTLVAISDASNQDLIQIEAELILKKYIVAKNTPKKKKDEKIKIKEYLTPQGIKVSVGKNNLQNDHLTFKVAKNYEYFFHVKDYPGAHVIAHTDTLDEAVIRFAANLAAYNSKARNSSSVAVDYCQVKYIKKPRNYVPGLVLISNHKTIFIDPVNPD